MKKSIAILATIMFLGLVAADVAVLQPMTAYAAAQTSGDQTEQPDDNAKNGQQGGGHSGHH